MKTMTDHEVLFIPGPVEVDEELRKIMAMPLIGHRNPKFIAEVQSVCSKLRSLYLANAGTTLFENAPATALMEAGIRNLVPGGGRVLHLTCGAFSERWAKISTACGRDADTLAVPWGEAVLPATLRERLRQQSRPYAAICITHNETSTGVREPLAELTAVCREESPGSLILVDVVTSVGGSELRFDDWGLDLAFAGTQKCLALPPGLVTYAVSDRALEHAATVEDRGFLFDFLQAKKGLANGRTPATPNVPLVFALSRQLDRIADEGLENRWQRHLDLQACTADWANEHGCEFFVEEAYRSRTVTTLRAPGRDIIELAAKAKAAGYAMDKGYGKLKGEAFRVGHMGDHSVERLRGFLNALM